MMPFSLEVTKNYKIEDIPSLLDGQSWALKKRGQYYLDCPLSFDIEVSSFYDKGEKRAVMYAWVLGINGRVIFGRTWEEAIRAFDEIAKWNVAKDLREGGFHRVLIFVHNLSYEFQWLRFLINCDQVFALSERDPIKVVDNARKMEFRCSYHLSGYSLNMVSKNLLKYKVRKLVGDLDYSLIRFPTTPLTQKEWGYIRNDGLVVMAYIKELMEEHGNIARLPMTSTGFVRKYCRDCCLYDGGGHHGSKGCYNLYRNIIKPLTLEKDEYIMLRNRVFQGGFTHASHLWSRITANDVTSYDFTSSYPATMVLEKFPMSKGKKVKITSSDQFKKLLQDYCVMFDVTFYNIRNKIGYENYLSSSKCRDMVSPSIDNGRIEKAKELTTSLTDLDFDIVKKVYEWEGMKVFNVWYYKKDYLPFKLVMAILELYADKTTLKGQVVHDVERRYLASKSRLNSTFGMAVTDICRDNITYENDEWGSTPPDIDEVIEKYNNDKTRFLFYPWGVWVTAWGRHNLWEGILALGKSDLDGSKVYDYIYSDTDSLKFVHAERHERFFKDYNDRIIKKIKHVSMARGIPLEKFIPKTIKGKEKPIGVFDFDGHYQKFKTLGAKRYMTRSVDHGLSITISGVSKRHGCFYLLSKYGSSDKAFDAFKEGLVFPANFERFGESFSATGKNIHSYLDFAFKGSKKDYLGNMCTYSEKSGVHMEGCGYNLSLSSVYLEYLAGVTHREVS